MEDPSKDTRTKTSLLQKQEDLGLLGARLDDSYSTHTSVLDNYLAHLIDYDCYNNYTAVFLPLILLRFYNRSMRYRNSVGPSESGSKKPSEAEQDKVVFPSQSVFER